MPEVAQATDDVPKPLAAICARRQAMDAAYPRAARHVDRQARHTLAADASVEFRPASRLFAGCARRHQGGADQATPAAAIAPCAGPRGGVRFGRMVCWGGGACREDIFCDVVGDACCGVLDGVSGEVGVACGCLDLGVAEELGNHRQALAERERAACISCDGGRGCARRRGRRGRARGSRARRCWRAAAPFWCRESPRDCPALGGWRPERPPPRRIARSCGGRSCCRAGAAPGRRGAPPPSGASGSRCAGSR